MNLLTTRKGFADVHSRNFSPAMVWGGMYTKTYGKSIGAHEHQALVSVKRAAPLFSLMRRRAVIAWQNWKGLRCSWLYHNICSFQILKPQTSDVQNFLVFVICLSEYDITGSTLQGTFQAFLHQDMHKCTVGPRIFWDVLPLAKLHPCAAEQCKPVVETKSLRMRALSCFHAWLCARF